MNGRKIGLLSALLLSWVFVMAQEPVKLFSVKPDKEETKLLRGIIQRSDVTSDTTFRWYQENLKYFKPDAEVVKLIGNHINDVQVVIFAGTWCHDSQQIFPKYLATLDAAGFPESNVTLIAMDREKTTVADFQKVFQVTNVPTLLLMKGGKEVGRIVEYGNTALMDKELGALFQQLNQ